MAQKLPIPAANTHSLNGLYTSCIHADNVAMMFITNTMPNKLLVEEVVRVGQDDDSFEGNAPDDLIEEIPLDDPDEEINMDDLAEEFILLRDVYPTDDHVDYRINNQSVHEEDFNIFRARLKFSTIKSDGHYITDDGDIPFPSTGAAVDKRTGKKYHYKEEDIECYNCNTKTRSIKTEHSLKEVETLDEEYEKELENYLKI